MSKKKQRRTLALDFDGVLHAYNGWNNGLIAGPIPGALTAVRRLCDMGHEVVVFTTRDARVVNDWLAQYHFPALEVTNIKRPFYVLVDDRAVPFTGTWSPELVERIARFQPYWILDRKPPQASP